MRTKLRRLACYGLTCCGLLTGVAGQTDHPQPIASQKVDQKELSVALARVKSQEFIGYDAQVIAEAHAIQAIPDLEAQFVRLSKPPVKPLDKQEALVNNIDRAKIAQVLVLLGDRKDTYWNFLIELAKTAVESDAPDPFQYNAQGKVVGPSSEFEAWAKLHNQLLEDVGANALFVFPATWGSWE